MAVIGKSVGGKVNIPLNLSMDADGTFAWARCTVVRTGHDLWLLRVVFPSFGHPLDNVHVESLIIGPAVVDMLKEIGVPVHGEVVDGGGLCPKKK